MINISKLKINCTSIAALISSSQGNTPPTEKQWKDFFNTINKPVEKLTNKQMFDIKNIVMKQVDYNPDDLSETVTKEMCEIYAQEIYGKYTLSGGGLKPHTLDKGNLAEDSAIDFLSKTDGVKYMKNERVISNPYFKGKPDILITVGDRMKDVVGLKEIKIPYDYPSFLRLYDNPMSKQNSWQMQGYMDILKLDEAELIHCLVNMPESMIEARMDDISERCFILGIPDEEIKQRCDFLRSNMTYDNIPDELKLIRITLQKNSLRIKEARSRVKLARKWITDLHDKIEKNVALAKK
jgi:hypothetical protein